MLECCCRHNGTIHKYMRRIITSLSRTTSSVLEKALKKNQWDTKKIDGISLIFSPLLSEFPQLAHAFTTRLGGASAEPLEWFNLGRHWPSEESRQDAMQNRFKLCNALSLNSN